MCSGSNSCSPRARSRLARVTVRFVSAPTVVTMSTRSCPVICPARKAVRNPRGIAGVGHPIVDVSRPGCADGVACRHFTPGSWFLVPGSWYLV